MSKKIIFFLLLIFFTTKINAKEKNDYFKLGKKFFESSELNKAITYFEKDIVRNPKNTLSYLFLAKVHKIKKNKIEFEKNLNTVLLLEPNNEEALYHIILKKINEGDFKLAKEKLNIFESKCIKMCSKKDQLKKLIKKI